MQKKISFLFRFKIFRSRSLSHRGFTPLEKRRQRRLMAASGGLSLTGFTLLEILVSMVVLASATAGLFASFVATQKFVMRSRHRLQAANGCRMILEDLRAYVNQNNWNDAGTNLLACPGTCNYTLPAADFPPGPPWNWSATYTVSPVNVGGIQMRQVTAKVSWTEPVS